MHLFVKVGGVDVCGYVDGWVGEGVCVCARMIAHESVQKSTWRSAGALCARLHVIMCPDHCMPPPLPVYFCVVVVVVHVRDAIFANVSFDHIKDDRSRKKTRLPVSHEPQISRPEHQERMIRYSQYSTSDRGTGFRNWRPPSFLTSALVLKIADALTRNLSPGVAVTKH